MRTRVEPQVRGERLVGKVLEAALEELATTGYAALSIESVADRAGVAKTTIYRRWPEKDDLVLAAMKCVADDFVLSGDTGSIRDDLFALLKRFRDFASTTRGASLMRMMQVEGVASELTELTRRMRKDKETVPQRMVARAIRRRELPRGTDPQLLLDTLFAAVQNMLMFKGETCDDRKIAQLVDLVLVGAVNGGGRRLRRAK
ncbi:MAG: Transcriptional regulator, TetR family [Labilithrix sp.]|nr:Transcriptional regulator, TetR family [Labilithrix sp.]